ncbi:MAG: hypothetical protein KatS3mg035_1458 [Bacteroidia bacterium]|nr:MAG: hypothetical protein KatS3mg035_1458 [Bacteroidia bacterium]
MSLAIAAGRAASGFANASAILFASLKGSATSCPSHPSRLPQSLAFLFLFFFFIPLNAQIHQDTTKKPLIYYFQNGKTTGLWRNHFMFTDNTQNLIDFGALATSLNLQYKTLPLKNISFSTGFSAVSNLWQQNLLARDPQTNQPSRYEIGLYDVTNPNNYKAIFLLSDLSIHYAYKNWKATLGKQLIRTPFINPQDGRMVPTLVEGLYVQKQEKKGNVEIGFLYKIAPRGVSKWYSVAQSIGIYPQGVQPNGTPSQYAGNTFSQGIGLLGYQKNIHSFMKMKLHNLYVDNIMNTAFFQMDFFQYDSSRQSQWSFSVQTIRQDALGNGGNIEAHKRYFTKNGKSMTFGGRLAWENAQWNFSLNYNRITAIGRFLIPREWGIEPFFTFLPRERSDGFGNAHAYALKTAYSYKKSLKLALQSAYVQLPDVKNFALNKYGMPSYWQNNLEIRFYPNGFFKNLELLALFVYKYNIGETYNQNKYLFNKTNMFQWNLITNYRF